jgi:malate/lactate dehydrogenase
MRSKVTCTAETFTGELIGLLIAQLDLSVLVLLGGREGLAEDLAGAAGPQGYEPRIHAGTWTDAGGSDLVIVDAIDQNTGEEIARRCAGAVVIVATPTPVTDVQRLLGATRLPRARIVGAAVEDAGPFTAAARAAELADAVLRDRRRTLRAAVLGLSDDADEGVALREARIGAGGIQAISEKDRPAHPR